VGPRRYHSPWRERNARAASARICASMAARSNFRALAPG
jgi:hypothetical protein